MESAPPLALPMAPHLPPLKMMNTPRPEGTDTGVDWVTSGALARRTEEEEGTAEGLKIEHA